jgi:hypothetical protein
MCLRAEVNDVLAAVNYAAGHNVKVTADQLELDRRTVWHRLDKIATGLGWSPEVRRAELEVALRLEALDDATRETGQADCK